MIMGEQGHGLERGRYVTPKRRRGGESRGHGTDSSALTVQ